MFEGKKSCEDCKWYEFIDSGYGYCKRFPPIEKLTSNFSHLKVKIEYTVVPWTMRVCGEFEFKEQSND